MKVDVKEGTVTLTCQSALVNSSLPILESVREVVISRVYAGTICHLFPNSDSALVKFYNGVTGILFLKQVWNGAGYCLNMSLVEHCFQQDSLDTVTN